LRSLRGKFNSSYGTTYMHFLWHLFLCRNLAILYLLAQTQSEKSFEWWKYPYKRKEKKRKGHDKPFIFFTIHLFFFFFFFLGKKGSSTLLKLYGTQNNISRVYWKLSTESNHRIITHQVVTKLSVPTKSYANPHMICANSLNASRCQTLQRYSVGGLVPNLCITNKTI
jgi:hypothetical protein